MRMPRLLLLTLNEEVVGYCAYLLASNPAAADAYFRRDTRLPIDDAPSGSIIYIEQVESLWWDRALLRQVTEALTQAHPQWQQGIWYRSTPRGWRRYTWSREGIFHGEDVAGPCREPQRVGATP